VGLSLKSGLKTQTYVGRLVMEVQILGTEQALSTSCISCVASTVSAVSPANGETQTKTAGSPALW
jgi:hypothetical protein